MSNDFDSNTDFEFEEFEDFDDDLEAFDEFEGGEEDEDPALRTAVLQKNNMQLSKRRKRLLGKAIIRESGDFLLDGCVRAQTRP